MKCQECGNENPAGAKFCNNCGSVINEEAKVPDARSASVQAPQAGQPSANSQATRHPRANSTEDGLKRWMNIPVLGGIIGTAFLIAGLWALTAQQVTTINYPGVTAQITESVAAYQGWGMLFIVMAVISFAVMVLVHIKGRK